MEIILTPVPDRNPRDMYVVHVHVMHGDADEDETIEIICKTKEQFIQRMNAKKTKPMSGSKGGDEDKYAKWCEDNFSDYIPYDITTDHQMLADVQRVVGFYFDSTGKAFEAKIVE